MAKKDSIEKNKRRIRLAEQDLTKRLALKNLIMNKETSIDDRFQAQFKTIQNEKKWCKIKNKKSL